MNDLTIFLIALALLALFIAYFAVDSSKPKRWIGTILAVGVTAFSLYYYFTLGIPLGIDLKGGSSFILEIEPEEDVQITEDDQSQAISVLRERLNESGTKDLLIAPSGTDRIIVQMPGISPAERDQVRQILRKTAKLELVLTHPQSGPGMVSRVREGEVIPGYRLAEGYDGDPSRAEVVKQQADIGGEHVQDAGARYSPQGWQIDVQLDGKGGEKMFRLTGDHTGERMAILVDGEAISAPVIQSQFGANFQVTGQFTEQEARELAAVLKNPLKNPIKIVQESSVSPAMGKDTIRQGLFAGVGGLAVTLLLVLLYYKMAGVIATVALAINVAVIFGVMAMFGFTLTMPGIAGVILTIGIAIDASVLIFERLREEQQAGKSLGAALEAAYGKAFSAIFDANLTTLLAAFSLFLFATGALRGFAITLTIGVFGTLFSALLVSRLCFSWLTAGHLLKKIRLWSVLGELNYDFLGKRKMAAVVSAVLLLVALGTLGMKRSNALAVDLKGGDLITLMSQGSDDLSVAQIEEALSDLSLDTQPVVQRQQNVGTDSTFFTIRCGFEAGGKIIDELSADLKRDFSSATIESVGPAVGGEMLKSSAVAMAIGLALIMLYVTVRFEFAFALGALAALLHDLTIVIGLVVLFGHEVSLIMVGAFLTIAGYSINDTIVVFDRVREGLQTKRGNIKDVMNYCINATLSRTLLTSFTTLIVVLALMIFGGPSLGDFALTLLIGVLIGTYSSIFVASPVVLWWARTRKTNLRREVLDTEQAKIDTPASA